jgi:hypothetical protein
LRKVGLIGAKRFFFPHGTLLERLRNLLDFDLVLRDGFARWLGNLTRIFDHGYTLLRSYMRPDGL